MIKENFFTSGSLLSVFLKTASPIVLIMLVSGSFTLLDAYFLGAFVGSDALTAVTLMFPPFMLIVATSTLVSGGFASIIARLLGAGEIEKARSSFSQAITLSMIVCATLITLFLIAGDAMSLKIANDKEDLAQMGHTYIAILIWFSPITFILTVNSDLLRSEGNLVLMASVALGSIILNGIFNYIFIVSFEMGVAGSAYGTILAQAISIFIIAVFRKKQNYPLNVSILSFTTKRNYWFDFLALGAPPSLNYLGIALSTMTVMISLQYWNSSESSYESVIGAYGIITRIMTFVFLPLLGLSMAFQTIVGNNIGAKKWDRANTAIKIALASSFVYCVTLQIIAYLLKDNLGLMFVNDATINAHVARILPTITITLFLVGPLMMVSTFFQANGDALRASILGITKTYIFILPLTISLPFIFGENGIWYAGPLAEIFMLILTITVLYLRHLKKSNPYGLFFDENQ